MKHSHYPLRHENHNPKAILPTSRIVTQDGQVLVNEVLDADYGYHLIRCANAVESIGGDPETAGKLLAMLETLVKWLDDSGLSHTKGGGFPPFTYGPTEYQVVKDARCAITTARKFNA